MFVGSYLMRAHGVLVASEGSKVPPLRKNSGRNPPPGKIDNGAAWTVMSCLLACLI